MRKEETVAIGHEKIYDPVDDVTHREGLACLDRSSAPRTR
jgi:hypothetical protein